MAAVAVAAGVAYYAVGRALYDAAAALAGGAQAGADLPKELIQALRSLEQHVNYDTARLDQIAARPGRVGVAPVVRARPLQQLLGIAADVARVPFGR